MFKLCMKKMHKKKNNKGFSLVELLVALILLAIIITPLFNAFISSAKINRNARKIMVATDIGQNIIEGYSTKTYETLCSSIKAAETQDLVEKCSFATINNGLYNISSNWISLDTNTDITNAFSDISPVEIDFVGLDNTIYGVSTSCIISSNKYTESMNQIIGKAIASSVTGQNVYYRFLNSTDTNYPNSGVIFMVYTNIVDPNRDLNGATPGPNDYGYNAVISIIPSTSGIGTNSYFYTYNIKVTIYDAKQLDATSDKPFGEPIITLLGGIPNK